MNIASRYQMPVRYCDLESGDLGSFFSFQYVFELGIVIPPYRDQLAGRIKKIIEFSYLQNPRSV
jgi:hypothetical protein